MAKGKSKKKAGAAGLNLSKRSHQKVLNAFQRAEREEYGSSDNDDADSDEDTHRVIGGVLDARRFLGEDGDNHGDFSDSEIDSDAALGSDDDYDVLNSKFSQTLRDKAKRRRLAEKRGEEYHSSSDDNDDEGYASIDELEMVPLSVAWDMDDADLAKQTGDVVLDDQWELESESELLSLSDSSDDSLDDELDVFEGFDDDNDVDLTKTMALLHHEIELEKPKQPKKLIHEKRDENEYALPTNGAKLLLQDMLGVVAQPDAVLIDRDTTPLAVPLPKRIQQRHDREAAFELTRKEIGKWSESIYANREAETLKFPIAPEPELPLKALTFRQEATPTTDLEKKIELVLKQLALLDEQNEATFEEIQKAKLLPEDLRKRTAELRQMRELMFRDEQRAKRLKKIKSKLYRRILKRERLRNADLVDELEGDEEGDDWEDADDKDMKRAEERMLLKHKTQGKWAKLMIKLGLLKDADSRAELEEMLRQGERLREKQMGHAEGDQSDLGVLDIEQEYQKDDAVAEDALRSRLGKGVLAMSFMKKSQEKQRQQNLAEIEEMKQLEEGYEPSLVNQHINIGRRVYTPGAAATKEEAERVNAELEQFAEDNQLNLLELKLRGRDRVVEEDSTTDANDQSQPANEEFADGANPWLQVKLDKHLGPKLTKIHVVDESLSKLAKAAAKIAKLKRSKHQEKELLIDIELHQLRAGDNDDGDDSDDGRFVQKDLISEAFAGDDVVAEFEAEKQQVIADEDDKEEDITLPGWGDWAGDLAPQQKRRKVVRKIDGVVQADQRRDKDLQRVIINEKVNKKNLKYHSLAVPFPYESQEQYERLLRMPLGQEWTSKRAHQRMTTPRVLIKQGTVIDPLKAPFKSK